MSRVSLAKSDQRFQSFGTKSLSAIFIMPFPARNPSTTTDLFPHTSFQANEPVFFRTKNIYYFKWMF